MNDQYQVFISFKNLDEHGEQTTDSVLARNVYDVLSARGVSVFFSNVSLEQLGISSYKKAIDDALDAAAILVAVGSSGAHLNSEWVRYEWDSFFNDTLSGVKPKGRLFTYLGTDAISDLPRTLRQNQCITHGPGSMETLCSFVMNALGVDSSAPTPCASTRASQTTTGPELPELKARFGRSVRDVVRDYPFILGSVGLFEQEKVYRATGKTGPAGDKEVECRICGCKEEFDRYPNELPLACRDCGFDGVYESRLFFGYSKWSADLANVVIRGLEIEEFHVRRSGYGLTNAGTYSTQRLKHGLSDRALYVCLWTQTANEDPLVLEELRQVRDLRLPALFLQATEGCLPPKNAATQVLDFSSREFVPPGFRPWNRYMIHEVCDLLVDAERRVRQAVRTGSQREQKNKESSNKADAGDGS